MEIKLNLNISDFRQFSTKFQKKIENAIADAIQEIDPVAILEENYHKSELKVRTGVLIGSFRRVKTANSLKLFTDVIYARIHDQGGYNGRGNKAYQKPKYYFTRASVDIREALRLKIKEKLK